MIHNCLFITSDKGDCQIKNVVMIIVIIIIIIILIIIMIMLMIIVNY